MSIPQLVAKMILAGMSPVRTVGDDEDEDEPDNAWAVLRSPSWGMDGRSGDVFCLRFKVFVMLCW
ncbi:hypothetical protein K443DRAFT_15259 [Laccaria amethystina LaAM-08-1]|uniref:Uncharacterized protein n=1 Tax=Laccaria amethystina LaAM-08-1 TaxID=1095629 RepID=A0A0C9WRD8_9AGAR|nr:hypothetical protein K443DRAFT_15259 [Laccaria amethystina LaAM-08-1]